jgi:hypothetical protein
MRSSRVFVCLAAMLAAHIAHASEGQHDIHFLMEHVPESAMDAHYLSLPWPPGSVAAEGWRPSVDWSDASTRTAFVDLEGPMLAFAATKRAGRGSSLELLGFHSAMSVSRSVGFGVLDTGYLRGVPLDLPHAAVFGSPHGTFVHFGVGAAYVRARSHGTTAHSPQLVTGLMLERADVATSLDYALTADTTDPSQNAAAGTLEHSARATFITPFVGWQQTRALGARWSWSPRALLVWPLPPADLDVRLTGPGFDLATGRDGGAIALGDPFAGLGLALAHMPTGIEVDVGGMLFFAAAEHLSHAGVDRAFALHLAWRPRPGRRSSRRSRTPARDRTPAGYA